MKARRSILSTLSLPDVLKGSQTPTHLVIPPTRISSAGAEAVELAASAGLILDPWQELALDAALSERADGQWAASEVGLIVPRQNGKSAVLEARELAGLFILGEELIVHTAHNFGTAKECFYRLRNMIDSTPDLSRLVRRITTANGDVGIELTSGARLKYLARTPGSGRGFSADCVIFDEAYRLPGAMLAAMMPTLSARKNPQVWYATSSPAEIDEQSEHIRRTKLRSSEPDPGGLCWIEWCGDLRDDPSDPAVWAKTNPALGIRIGAEDLDRALRTLPSQDFAVEHLGVWKTQSLSAKIPLHIWESIQVSESPGTEGVVFGLDIPPDRSSASVAACAPDGENGFSVELADRRPGTDWLIHRCIELSDRYPGTSFVIDTVGPAGGFVHELQNLGLKVISTTAREYSQACTHLFDAVMAKKLTHTGQPELVTAVMGAKTRTLGDSWAWSRTSSSVDIAPLVAATLALWGCSTIGSTPEASPAPVFAY